MRIIEWMNTLIRRLGRAFGRADFERQLNDELRFHVDAESAELTRRGVAPDEARRRALAALGGMERWREEARDTRATGTLERLARDARLSLRSLRRSPSYTIPVVVTLALGIGAMASIATLAYDVLFRPLPYREPDRLVAIFERNVPRQRERNVVSVNAVEGWKERNRTVDSISSLMPSTAVWQGQAGPERIRGAEVSASLFELLGRRPALGPGFSSSTATNEVVISHTFWNTRLGADSSIIGKSIRLDGRPVTVVGVMPPDFVPLAFGWMGEQEYWTPLVLTQYRNWGRFLLVVGRLKAGVTVDGASRDLEAIHAQLRAEGTIADGWYAQVIPLAQEITGSVRQAFLALLVACALLLAMVLTNTTLLTIAHAERRAADVALRSVLGATRSRLLSERLVTSVILAGVGAGAGVLLALFAIPALTAFLPEGLPRLQTVHFGSIAIGVGAGTGVIAALLLAIVPAMAIHPGVTTDMLHGGRRLTSGARTSWVVVGEAATAVVLSLFAGLTLRSFERLSAVDYGFNADRMIAFRVSFNAPGVSDTAARAASKAFFERVRAIPGVIAAGRTSVRPFSAGGTATTITPVGWGDKDRSAFPTADVRFVDSEYFTTLGLTTIEGRLFSSTETPGAPIRAVVNEAFGRKMWPGERGVVGRSFDVLVARPTPSPEIIGVVRDVRLETPREETRPTVYLYTEQMPDGETYDVLVRTSVDESTVVPQIREAVRAVSASTPIYRVESMRRTVDGTIARERVTAQLLMFFAAAALMLVAVGVYGLYAGEVTRRRREIGVRMALGETAVSVIRSVLARAVTRTLAGVVVGGMAGFAASRVLQSFLFGIATTDPLSYVGAAVVVLLTAIGATLVPALQASSVTPSEALRAE